jgi:hypothetical protein
MNKPVADDFDYISKRLKQIEAEKTGIINRREPECVPPEKADVPIEAYEDLAINSVPSYYRPNSIPFVGDVFVHNDGSCTVWNGRMWVSEEYWEKHGEQK